MVKLTKKSLDELAREMPVLSERELRMCVVGTGASYSEAEFYKLYMSGEWEGGVVEGWGNFASNIAVATYSDSVSSSYFMDGYVWANGCLWHNGYNLDGDYLFGGDSGAFDSGFLDDYGYESGSESGSEEERNKRVINYSNNFTGSVAPIVPIPDVGIGSIFYYKGYISIVNNDVSVGVDISNPHLRGEGVTYMGMVELYVDGVQSGSYNFAYPSNGMVYSTGDIPLGICNFSLPERGRIEGKLTVGCNYNSGHGIHPSNGTNTLYQCE